MPSLGFNVSKRTARIVDSGNEPITGSTGAAIGTAAAGMLLHPDEAANRFLKIRSTTITQNTCLTALEEVTGAEWDVTKVSAAEVRESKAKKIQEKRFQEAFLDVLAVQLFEDGTGRGMITPDDKDNQLLGVKEEGLGDMMRQLVDAK